MKFFLALLSLVHASSQVPADVFEPRDLPEPEMDVIEPLTDIDMPETLTFPEFNVDVIEPCEVDYIDMHEPAVMPREEALMKEPMPPRLKKEHRSHHKTNQSRQPPMERDEFVIAEPMVQTSFHSENEMDYSSSDLEFSFRKKNHGRKHRKHHRDHHGRHRRHHHHHGDIELFVIFFAGWGFFSMLRKCYEKCEQKCQRRIPVHASQHAPSPPSYYRAPSSPNTPVNQEIQYV